METEKKDNRGKIGIGDIENVTLKPAKVKILGFKIEMQKDKDKKEVGDKVSVICQHPDRENPIEISSVVYEKGDEIKTSGLWFKLDKDGKIVKNSALTYFLLFLKASNLDDIVGKDADTKLDKQNYLTFKAY